MKRKLLIQIGVMLFSCLFIISCDELIEEDLAGDKVIIVAPIDNTETVHQSIIFAWKEVEHCRSYHIQVAMPNFKEAETLLMDSIIAFPDSVRVKTSLTKDLFPADFQWRIKAFNGISSTPYTTAAFKILNTEDTEPDKPTEESEQ